MKIVEAAIDAALGEVRRQGGPDYLLTEARSEGLAVAKAFEALLVDRICFQIGQAHDTNELWSHMRQDPEAFRAAVRQALDDASLLSRNQVLVERWKQIVDIHTATVSEAPAGDNACGSDLNLAAKKDPCRSG